MSNPHEDTPECMDCGAYNVPLRYAHMATMTKPCDPVCEECFRPQQIGGDDSNGFPPACGVMDGPSFCDLPPCNTKAQTENNQWNDSYAVYPIWPATRSIHSRKNHEP